MIRLGGIHFVLLCAWLSLAGCTSPGPSTARRSIMHLQGADRAAVLDKAELALVKLGYEIERRDMSSGILEAVPITGARADRSIQQPARLSSRSGLRRIAEIRVEQVGDTVSVYCQVVVQEQTTQTHRLLRDDRRGYDVPTDTPIDREAATTVQQNTVWRTIRRAKDDERQILTTIAENTSSPDAEAVNP